MMRSALARRDPGEWLDRARVVAGTALLCVACWAASYVFFLMVTQ